MDSSQFRQARHALHGTSLALLVSFTLVSAYLFFSAEQSSRIIRARYPYRITMALVVPSFISAVVNIGVILIDYEIECIWWALATYAVGSNGLFLGSAALIVDLCLRYELQVSKCKHYEELKKRNNSGNIALVYREKLPFLIQRRFVKYFPKIAILVYFLFNVVIVVIFFNFGDDIWTIMYLDDACNDLSLPFVINWGVVVGVLLCLAGVMISSLRKVKDNYFLKNELQKISYILVYLLVFFIFYETIYPQLKIHSVQTLGYTPMIFQEIPAFMLVHVCLLEVFLKSRNEEKLIGSSSGSQLLMSSFLNQNTSVLTLKTEVLSIIKDPRLTPILKEFMIREFCVEEILFLSEVNTFKEKFTGRTSEDRMSQALMILETFVSEKSPLAVNLSWFSRSLLLDSLELLRLGKEFALTDSLFDSGFDEVLQLVATDVFMRFKKSAEFKTLLLAVENMVHEPSLSLNSAPRSTGRDMRVVTSKSGSDSR